MGSRQDRSNRAGLEDPGNLGLLHSSQGAHSWGWDIEDTSQAPWILTIRQQQSRPKALSYRTH